MAAAGVLGAVLLVCLMAVRVRAQVAWPAGLLASLASGGQQALSTLMSSSSARATLEAAVTRQLEQARQHLRRAPPVSEPPPDTTTLCSLAGHASCERHTIRTTDGFLLTVVRIGPQVGGAVPVLIMPGNFASSDSYMMRKDDSNIGTVMHQAGYDVWLGNWRGSTHSRSHETLNASDPEFWNWSWHEMGLYDLPACIDYILATSGQQSLHLLAHSMGTTAVLSGLAQRPEYNDKVRLAGLLAPSVRMRTLERFPFSWALEVFAGVRDGVAGFLQAANVHEVLPRSAALHYIGDLFCLDDSPLIGLCYALWEEMLGKGLPEQRLPDLLATFAAYHPAGTSFKCIEHVLAISRSGRFRPMGSRGINDPNPPPDYNLTAITAPVGLYYSTNDAIVNPKDVDNLARRLPRVHEKHLVPLTQFNHVDFMWAKDVRSLLYDHIVQTMSDLDAKVLDNDLN